MVSVRLSHDYFLFNCVKMLTWVDTLRPNSFFTQFSRNLTLLKYFFYENEISGLHDTLCSRISCNAQGICFGMLVLRTLHMIFNLKTGSHISFH